MSQGICQLIMLLILVKTSCHKIILYYSYKNTWHGGLGDFFVINFPDIRHVHHTDPTQRAGIVTIGQHFIKARLVNEMVTRRYLRRYTGGVDILLTHGAVGPGDFLHTFVCTLQMIGQAHVTQVAVEVITTATHLQ